MANTTFEPKEIVIDSINYAETSINIVDLFIS